MRPIIFAWPEGKSGAVTSSWDDGQIHDRRLVALLNERGLKGTWNLNASIFDVSDDHLRASEIRELFKGHEVACHTLNHPHLESQPDQYILYEVFENRRRLESLVGYPVRGFAFPFGTYDLRAVDILKQCGLLYCRTINQSTRQGLPPDFWQWHPTCHCRVDLLKSWNQFCKLSQPDKIFFVWGHSWEFERHGGWENFAAFSEVCGATDSVWHATNIDIVKYVTAWRNLWCSVTGSIVYNPSATSLWFRCGGDLFEAFPGKTLLIDGA